MYYIFNPFNGGYWTGQYWTYRTSLRQLYSCYTEAKRELELHQLPLGVQVKCCSQEEHTVR